MPCSVAHRGHAACHAGHRLLCASSAVGRMGVRCPSCVAMRRRRRLFVADRNSNKVTVYDSDGGKTLDIDVKVMARPQHIMNGVPTGVNCA